MTNIIGKNIRARREAKGWSQAELSHRCGWEHQSRVSGYERGEREPKQKYLKVIADALGCSVGELYMQPKGDEGYGGEVREEGGVYTFEHNQQHMTLELLAEIESKSRSGEFGLEHIRALRNLVDLMGKNTGR